MKIDYNKEQIFFLSKHFDRTIKNWQANSN